LLGPISFETNVRLISKRYYVLKAFMSARETAELLLQLGRLVQADGIAVNSAPPNGWRCGLRPC
jgi:hypothetical protein